MTRLGFRQRRRLGVTFSRVKEIVGQLQSEGQLADDHGLISAGVLNKLMEDSTFASSVESEGIDIEKLLEWIELLLPIILKLLGL